MPINPSLLQPPPSLPSSFHFFSSSSFCPATDTVTNVLGNNPPSSPPLLPPRIPPRIELVAPSTPPVTTGTTALVTFGIMLVTWGVLETMIEAGIAGIVCVGSRTDAADAEILAEGARMPPKRGMRALRMELAAPVASLTMLGITGIMALVTWGMTDTAWVGSKLSIGDKMVPAGPRTVLSRGAMALSREFTATVAPSTTLVTSGTTALVIPGTTD